ncbi:hypothetical protein CVIRNUC_004853 [Coccomyxa viridis]|uniref:Complex 1 LYR protein domain-containing protein n=1 Tax=Coccomyxa viridis TaxID=1274662 RepID=A0AAV1I5A3_9CHLO|nr:hypothetical protein CVIRNUC_004853 [Coccomyxa viridis]
MAQRANVLRAYRELLDLAKRLPIDKRNASLEEARKAMRSNQSEVDPVKQTDLLKELVAKVSFLRMTTPKTYRDRRTRHGSVTLVMRDGALVEGQGTSESRVADGTMSMEEARTRNKQLLKRQHFGRDPPDVRKFF